jgi:hypothetical protein
MLLSEEQNGCAESLCSRRGRIDFFPIDIFPKKNKLPAWKMSRGLYVLRLFSSTTKYLYAGSVHGYRTTKDCRLLLPSVVPDKLFLSHILGDITMTMQNLISAVLAPEVVTRVTTKLTEIKSDLSFLISLGVDEIRGLFKAGDTYSSFIDDAYDAVTAHPEMMPAAFDLEEFKKDYALIQSLVPLFNQIKELSDGIEKTLIAVNSDALAESLEIYAAVRQYKDKISGLSVTAEKMAKYFKKSKKSDSSSATTTTATK